MLFNEEHFEINTVTPVITYIYFIELTIAAIGFPEIEFLQHTPRFDQPGKLDIFFKKQDLWFYR